MNSWQEAYKKAQQIRLIHREQKQTTIKQSEELNLPFPLLKFQIEGIYFLLNKKKCILADDMGLGKTIQVISALVIGKIKKVLIICPKSVIKQWYEYFNNISNHNIDFEIINYEKLYHSSKKYTIKSYDCIVLDEAQKIKNINAKITKIILSFPQTKYRWVITGTPIENKLEEIIPLLLFIEEYDFINGKYIDFMTINQILFQKMLRRIKQFDLSIEYIDLVFKMDEKTKKDYNIMIEELFFKEKLINMLPVLVKIRQFCACPVLFSQIKDDIKFKRIYPILLGHKLKNEVGIIFTESKKIAQYIEEKLKNHFLIETIWGSKTKLQRQEIQKRFQRKEIDILILTKAGELGLDFQSGSFLIHYDVPYNPARIDQREGRILRIGQNNNIKIYFPYFKNSYEEKIFSIVSNKRILFNRIINSKKRSKIQMNKDMINYLFKKT